MDYILTFLRHEKIKILTQIQHTLLDYIYIECSKSGLKKFTLEDLQKMTGVKPYELLEKGFNVIYENEYHPASMPLLIFESVDNDPPSLKDIKEAVDEIKANTPIVFTQDEIHEVKDLEDQE